MTGESLPLMPQRILIVRDYCRELVAPAGDGTFTADTFREAGNGSATCGVLLSSAKLGVEIKAELGEAGDVRCVASLKREDTVCRDVALPLAKLLCAAIEHQFNQPDRSA